MNAKLILLTALLVLAGGLAGYAAGPLFARAHPRVRLAARIARENRGDLQETTLSSAAFRESGESPQALYAEARDIRGSMTIGGLLFGAWVGLVVGLKVIYTAREDGGEGYQIVPSMCVACGRCYESCPHERQRRGRAAGFQNSREEI